MIVLGVESTAHTFGIGVTDGKKLLVSERDIYRGVHGIIPVDAAKHHREVAKTVLDGALEKAGITLDDVDYVAFASGPGLPPCLMAGKEFVESLGKPVIPVNHCVAHIEIGRHLFGIKDPLTLYVSGGNSQILGYEDGRYRVYGETLDIGVGNAIDKFARSIGIGSPAGPEVEKIAKEGKKYIPLPYSVKGMDLVFSGLVTAASQKVGKVKKEDLVYSFQETAYSMLTEATERALAHTKKKTILLGGGVAANKRLQEMIKSIAKYHGAKFYCPDLHYCGDQGGMIALLGYLVKKPQKKWDINPRWRTDDVEVDWI
jgi:glycoprotease/Kae1 family metallohydrolase